MTTITDTSVLHWLPFDDAESDPWKLAFIDAENQNWNSTDLNNGTTTLEKMAASKHVPIACSPAQLGLATGLLLSLIINAKIWTKKATREGIGRKLLDNRKQYQWILHLTPSASFIFASTKTFILHYLYLLPLIAFLLLMPLLIAFLVILSPFIMYRLAVYAYLEYRKRKYNSKTKLLSGADAVWTFNESHESYSVINALLLLEGKPDILRLKEIFRSRFLAYPKLRMRRDSTLGYTTWYEDKELDLGNLVQWLPGNFGEEGKDVQCQESSGIPNAERERFDYVENSCDFKSRRNQAIEKWSQEKLSEIIGELCNLPLPESHSVSWEARVGKAMEWEECSDDDYIISKTKEGIQKSAPQTVFPVLFRIHHSIGDGASLLQLMMSTLIDNGSAMTNTSKRDVTELNRLNSSRKQSHSKTSNQILETEKSVSSLKKSYCEGQSDTSRDDTVEDKESFKRNSLNVRTKLPHIRKSFTKLKVDTKEKSYLYGHRLSGKKIILWDSASITVEDIKKIRAATGVKFTDILLSAVSASLANYWEFRKKASNEHLRNNNTLSERGFVGHNELNMPIGRMNVSIEGNFQNLRTSDSKEMKKPPSSVKLVIPAILGSLFQKPKCNDGSGCKELENLFSVAIMTLPIGESGGCPLKRLAKVTDASGFMMPIRKESIIDYKSKLNNQVFSKKPEKSESLPPVSEKKKEKAKTGAGRKHVLPNEKKSVEIGKQNSSDFSKKTGAISPNETEVLTYYYTANNSDPIQKIDARQSKENSTVFYHKKDDSAKLIIHNKEPYSCPTTIFFTHKNQNSLTLSSNKYEQEERAEERFGEVNCFSEFHDEGRETATSGSKECGRRESGQNPPDAVDVDQQKFAPPTPSLNLPSSPTIQHLIMRWLALDIVATVIPSFLASPMMAFASKGVAVVMSNLPGPSAKLQSVLGGHPMKEIVFWAPHRGYTGVGITVISYNGKLEIGLMVDTAVVPTRSGARFIINSLLDELHSLGGAVSNPHH